MSTIHLVVHQITSRKRRSTGEGGSTAVEDAESQAWLLLAFLVVHLVFPWRLASLCGLVHLEMHREGSRRRPETCRWRFEAAGDVKRAWRVSVIAAEIFLPCTLCFCHSS
jgi:hypothetical protein